MRERTRILYLEDEPEFADLTESFLGRELDAVEIVSRRSADGDIEGLSLDEFDCIVSDFDMPGPTGLDFLEAVRETNPTIPFILFTGKGSEEVASEAISAGVTDYLQKESGSEQFELLANRIQNAVEQYRAARRARRAEELMRELAENSTDVLWMFSADWDEVLFINSAYEEVWGHCRSRLRADPTRFLEAIHPADRELAEQAVDRLRDGEAIDAEIRVNPDEGYGRHVWLKAQPIVQAGDVIRIVGFGRDVTSRKQRETELQRYQTIVESVPDPVYVLDEDGHIEMANEALVDLLGPPRDKLLGTHVSEYIPAEALDRGNREIREVLQAPAGSAGSFQMRIQVDDGDERVAETHFTVLTENGTFEGTVGVVREHATG